MKMTSTPDNQRFQNGANDYAAYLETPEGRLRCDLAFASLEEFLPQPQGMKALRALDVGCGTGAIGIRLARLGIQVTLVDSSESMLDLAKRAVQSAGVTDKVTLQHGDATQLATLFQTRTFDIVLCHNILEYVDDPVVVLRGAACALRDSSGILSIVVRNRAGEVSKAAILAGDLVAAERNLEAEWGQESLYGGKVRLFSPGSLQAVLQAASLTTIAQHGVRVLADYLPPRISRRAEYDRIFELERKLGKRPDFAAVARYTHCMVRRTG